MARSAYSTDTDTVPSGNERIVARPVLERVKLLDGDGFCLRLEV
jgi:hypothetical protein